LHISKSILDLINTLSRHEKNTTSTINLNRYFQKYVIDPTEITCYINRRNILHEIVRRITQGAQNDIEKIRLWTMFLQDKIIHPKHPPIIECGQLIFDPIWILKNKVAQCGQVNRLVVDGLETLGFKGRVVQLSNHVIAEVYVDGRYLALDADLLDYGSFFYNKHGRIVSAMEIFLNPKILERLQGQVYSAYPEFKDIPHDENYWYNYLLQGFVSKPYYYKKTASLKQLDNQYFGWNYYDTVVV
jgi:hypothetical protein